MTISPLEKFWSFLEPFVAHPGHTSPSIGDLQNTGPLPHPQPLALQLQALPTPPVPTHSPVQLQVSPVACGGGKPPSWGFVFCWASAYINLHLWEACLNRRDTLFLILNYHYYPRSSSNTSHNSHRILTTDEFPAYCNRAHCPAAHSQGRNTGGISRMCWRTDGPTILILAQHLARMCLRTCMCLNRVYSIYCHVHRNYASEIK